MNGGLGEVISQPPLHFNGVGVFPSSNSIKIKIMAVTTTPTRTGNRGAAAQNVAPTQTTQQDNYRGKIVANLTINQFKLDFGIKSFEVKQNPDTGALCMYDGVNVLGATGKKYDADLAAEDLQIIKIEDEGEDVYVLTKRGSGGISDWDTLASY